MYITDHSDDADCNGNPLEAVSESVRRHSVHTQSPLAPASLLGPLTQALTPATLHASLLSAALFTPQAYKKDKQNVSSNNK